jgi:hypothetical protein
MIHRLALVVWWLGVIVLVVGVWSGSERLIARHTAQERCAPIFAEQDTWLRESDRVETERHRAAAAAVALAKEAAEKENKKFDDDDAAGVQLSAEVAGIFREPVKRVDLDEDLTRCEAKISLSKLKPAAIEEVFALGAFVLVYVLSGYFWRPPKPKDT